MLHIHKPGFAPLFFLYRVILVVSWGSLGGDGGVLLALEYVGRRVVFFFLKLHHVIIQIS